ncbi:hypothetical protein VIGAN_06142700 [Vigna angularis var. angularis]|uniref:Uncharacterized protein n=1 Tax=Vigna angularis var. angularis TaxID=157739 RepID=A0A0S3SBI3_PHAAN|nr:hypothetical protein VIGAN_06142700 [Vigna angularis var. angularis]
MTCRLSSETTLATLLRLPPPSSSSFITWKNVHPNPQSPLHPLAEPHRHNLDRESPSQSMLSLSPLREPKSTTQQPLC